MKQETTTIELQFNMPIYQTNKESTEKLLQFLMYVLNQQEEMCTYANNIIVLDPQVSNYCKKEVIYKNMKPTN